MKKLTEKELQQKVKVHQNKVEYYQKKLDAIKPSVIGFIYKNKDK